jgi:sulfonate transport system substrate-binding protein
MRYARLALAAAIVVASAGLPQAQTLIEKPAALPQPVKLTLGFAKVGHLAPLQLIEADLKSMNVTLERVEFVRYADARTALASGSLDLATVGPADVPIALSQNITSMVALMGVGASPKYVVVRNGVKMDEWKDIVGKKVAIAPGSAVWFQFAATVQELGIAYNQIQTVNIQGGGANFNAALKRGEVDAIVSWEPFESTPVIEGYGYWATKLDYSISKAVGAELGLIAASRSATTEKREAVRRFIWAYIKAQNELAADKAKFAETVAAFTNVDRKIADRIADSIKLGAVLSLDQMKRQAETFHKLGVIQKNVTAELDKFYEGALVDSVLKK